jgi:hypothetical protein
MKNKRLVICALGAISFLVFIPNAARALSIEQAREAIADRLVAEQAPDGSWPGEVDYTGSIVAGMARAYEVVGKDEYKVAAELGGDFILEISGGNFYGDEAYALALLSEVTGDTAYADAVREFYLLVDTYEYISAYQETDRSNAVFYIAHHAVAAHKVEAADAGVWRQALIDYLSLIADDVAYYPVMSLGVATWALAQTGPLDDTKLDPFYWGDVALSDLPDILLSHLVINTTEGITGTFYHRFDHTAADEDFKASGYTEDTVFAVLGLMEATTSEINFDEEIVSAQVILCLPILSDGIVYEHILSSTLESPASYYVFGGDVLRALQ